MRLAARGTLSSARGFGLALVPPSICGMFPTVSCTGRRVGFIIPGGRGPARGRQPPAENREKKREGLRIRTLIFFETPPACPRAEELADVGPWVSVEVELCEWW